MFAKSYITCTEHGISVYVSYREGLFPGLWWSFYKATRSVGNKFGKGREENTQFWTFLIRLSSALYFQRLCSSLKPLFPPLIQAIFLSLLLNGAFLEKKKVFFIVLIYKYTFYDSMYIYSDQKSYIQISVAQILAVWLKCMCLLSKANMLNHLSSVYED